MNKLLLLAFLVSLLALTAAGSQQQQEQSALDRTAREADARKNKPNKPNRPNRPKPKRRTQRNRRKLKQQRSNKGNNIRPSNGRKPNNKPRQPNTPKRRSNKPRIQCGRQGANHTCLEAAMQTLKIMKDNVNNYIRQVGRISRANKTGKGKSGKKGVFGPVIHQLMEAGGDNKSALACNGQTNSSGALQLQNLTTTLLKCEKNIHAACHPDNMPMPNNTEVTACVAKMDEFKALVNGCQPKKGQEACDCWLDAKFPPLETEIKKCKLADSQKAVIAQLSACRGNFSYCKKFEDEAVKAISSCSKDSSKLLIKAKKLTANVDSLGQAKDTASKLAGNSSRQAAVKRAVAADCAEVISLITKMLNFVDENPSSPLIVVIAAKITGATGITCSATEKSSLTTQVTTIETAIVTVTAVLTTVQDNLKLVSGTTPSTSDIASATEEPTATAASAGRRNIVARHLMNRLNLH